MLEEYKRDRHIWEENYDAVNLRSDILVTARAMTLLGDVHGKRILDIGCGNGKVSRMLAKQGAEVFGIDVTKEQIAFAEKIEQERKQGIKYFVGDINSLTSIDFLPKEFDIVISLMVHLYLPKEEFVRSFKNISEKLIRGGRFIYGNAHPSRAFLYPNADYFQSQLLKGSFTTMGTETFTTEFYHHPMNLLVNSVVDANLSIRKLYEPRPEQFEIEQYPTLLDPKDKMPQYLLIDCSK